MTGSSLLPAECTLETPESTQRLLVQQDEPAARSAAQVARGDRMVVERPAGRRPWPTAWSGPSGDGEAVDRGEGRRPVGPAKVVVTGMGRPFELELPQPRRAGLRQAGVQLRGLPRGPGGQGGLPALAPRLRPGRRLLQHRQARPRPAGRARRPRPEPGPGQALRGHPPQGRGPVRDRLARIPDPRRLDRRRGRAAGRRRPPGRVAGGPARPLDPPGRPGAADRRPRPLHRRPRRGRHPMGQMVVDRRVGLPGRRRRASPR